MDPVQHAIAQLSRFPSVGKRTASKMVFWLMQQDPQVATDIGAALCELPTKNQTLFCLLHHHTRRHVPYLRQYQTLKQYHLCCRTTAGHRKD